MSRPAYRQAADKRYQQKNADSLKAQAAARRAKPEVQEARRVYDRAYRQQHKDALDAQAEARYIAEPEKLRHYQRTAITKRYGKTVTWFDQQLADQQGRCPLCDQQFGTSTPHIDHCHSTGHVRKLLCGKCNKMIGLAHESSATLLRAAAYLNKHKQESDHIG